MNKTGYPAFDATVDKTNQVRKKIEQAYQWPKERRQQSSAALRGVLHAREIGYPSRRPPTSLHSCPFCIYYEGWDPARVPMKMSRDGFTARVRREFPYEIEGGIEPLITTVLRAIGQYVTPGEWKDIASSLPKDLAAMLPAST